MEPISATTAFAFLNSAFRITEFFYRIAEVVSENEVFVRTITVVRNDLLEVERLLSLPTVQARLLPTPAKLGWIRGSLHSTKSVLNEIGRWVEKARMEQQALGSVKFNTRLKWIFNDHEKLVNRQTELSTCHQQLSNVLTYLVGMEDVDAATAKDPPKYLDVACFDDLISPRQRRRSSRPTKEMPSVEKLGPTLTAVQITRTTEPYRPTISVIQSNHVQGLTEAVLPSSPPPAYSTLVGTISTTTAETSREKNPPYPLDESWEYKYFFGQMQKPELEGSVPRRKPLQLETSQLTMQEAKQQHQPSAQEIYQYNLDNMAGSTPTGLFAAYSMGPVNPSELYGTIPPPLQAHPNSASTSNHQKRPAQAFGELLGDTSYAVELPAHSILPKQQVSVPKLHVSREASYHGTWNRRSLSNTVAELPARFETPIHNTKSESTGAHSDQEVASYTTRRMQSQKTFRNLLENF